MTGRCINVNHTMMMDAMPSPESMRCAPGGQQRRKRITRLGASRVGFAVKLCRGNLSTLRHPHNFSPGSNCAVIQSSVAASCHRVVPHIGHRNYKFSLFFPHKRTLRPGPLRIPFSPIGMGEPKPPLRQSAWQDQASTSCPANQRMRLEA